MQKANGITKQKIIEEAQRRGWRVAYFEPGEWVYEVIAPSGQRCFFTGSVPQTNSWIATRIADHKSWSYHYLPERLGIPVPPFLDYDNDDKAAEAFLKHNTPIVVKPEDSVKSRGVTVNVTTMSQLHTAIKEARRYSDYVILQKQLPGKSYRLLTIGGTFFAAAHRRAPFVLGDGKHTVQELVEMKNADPLRGENGNAPLEALTMSQVERYLGVKRMQSIPKDGREVEVLPIASISAGGEATDVTDEVHHSYIEVVEKIAGSLDLAAAGIDIVTPDISQPLDKREPFPFLEINARPGLKMHHYPTGGGKSRNAAAALLDAVFGSS